MIQIKVFTDRYPSLGPVVWILSVQYFIAQYIVAASWKIPTYSWRHNTISDLGNTACGYYGSHLVCSPLHGLMNASFITLGVSMAIGSLLIYQEFRERSGTLIGFSLMALGGVGTLIVGLFPENTIAYLHIIGAGLPFVLGNLSLIIFSKYISNLSKAQRIYTVLSGLIPLIALVLLLSHHYLGLGVGAVERIVSYPQTVWLVFFGLYMSCGHYLKAR